MVGDLRRRLESKRAIHHELKGTGMGVSGCMSTRSYVGSSMGCVRERE
jgi:hypothetical protein